MMMMKMTTTMRRDAARCGAMRRDVTGDAM